MRLLKWAKKVTLRDAKEDVDKTCIEVQKNFWKWRWKTCTRFLTLTQNITYFELRLRLWNHINGIALKNYEFEVGNTHEKSKFPVSNTFMPS